jgi:DUF1680 family protein
MVFWNQRMNLLTGESKYIDVLERSLYNGALDGISLRGDKFFYGNPLATQGNYGRSEWFGTACCPSNISRLIASVGGYIYASSKDATWINLFVASKTTIETAGNSIKIEQRTNFPWDGQVIIAVSPNKKSKHTIKIRIPGWAQGKAVGDTYTFLEPDQTKFQISMARSQLRYVMENGYAVVTREWKKGDEIILDLPMEVRRVISNSKVLENQNKVALQRGPLVYCLEHPDNNGHVFNIILSDSSKFQLRKEPDLLGGIVSIETEAAVAQVSSDGHTISTVSKQVKAIPYYTWANRGEGEMQVWIPRKASSVIIK